jgi:dipeptidyl aminopeptidase/acylaminoacyl peptidase
MKITRLTNTGRATRAAISPDGKYVAYVKDEAGQQSLWLILVATTSEERIVSPAEVDYRGLTFSHDSNFIYYVRADQDNPTGVLYLKPVLGGEARKLFVNIGSPITLSPDGKRLAFVRGSLSQKESALMVANVDGTEAKKLATHKDPDSFSLSGPGLVAGWPDYRLWLREFYRQCLHECSRSAGCRWSRTTDYSAIEHLCGGTVSVAGRWQRPDRYRK